MVLAIAGGLAAHLSAGWASRFPDYVRPEIAGQQHLSEGTCFLRAGQPATAYAGVEPCTHKSSGGPSGDSGKVLVWGDSFAAHLMPGFKAIAGNFAVLQATASACPPVQGFHQPRRPGCMAFNEAVLKMIESERPDVVVMSGRWLLYSGRWLDTGMIQATVDRIRRTGAEVVLVGQSPSFDFDHPYDAVYLSKRDTVQVTTNDAVAAMVERVRNVAMFDPISTLCGGGVCGLKDGSSWLYFDGGHLSVDGSRKLVNAMMPYIRAAQMARAARVSASTAR